MTTPQEEFEIDLWTAFERLDHAHLLHDQEAVARELQTIAQLRERAVDQHTAQAIERSQRRGKGQNLG